MRACLRDQPILPRRWTVAAIAMVAAVWFCYAGGQTRSGKPLRDFVKSERLGTRRSNRAATTRNCGIGWDDTASSISITPTFLWPFPITGARSSSIRARHTTSSIWQARWKWRGKTTKRTAYFRAAQAAYPISAEVSWKYGNFLLRQDRLTEAYAEIHRAVMVDPQADSPGGVARLA